MSANRGEVWLADLGMAAKVRPVLVISVEYGDRDYALLGVVPHTTNPRGSQFEVNLSVVGLQPGAFNIQGMIAVPNAKLLRKVAALTPAQQTVVEAAIRRWLGLV